MDSSLRRRFLSCIQNDLDAHDRGTMIYGPPWWEIICKWWRNGGR